MNDKPCCPECQTRDTDSSRKRAVSITMDVLDCAGRFGKMLHDQSQLARVYLHAWQVIGNEFFRTITEEILDYVVREMLDPAGGFYSTQDADSEGEEGKFFVWTPDEIRDVLGDEADAFVAAYGVTHHGNFEGKSILEFVGEMEQRPTLAEARRKLFEAREERVHPGATTCSWRFRQLPSNAAELVCCIAAVPLLHNRGLLDGYAAAYVVCRNLTCQAPVTDPEALRAEVERG